MRPQPLAIAALLALPVFVGCKDEVPAVAPALASFTVQNAEGDDVDLLAPPDGGVTNASALTSMVATFTQLLEGGRIEDLDAGSPVPRADVVTLSWRDPTGGRAPIALPTLTLYDPGGILNFGPGPRLLVQTDMGLPSGALLDVTFAPDRIVGRDGRLPYTGPRMLSFSTQPFAVTIDVGEEPVAPAFEVGLQFSNLPAADVNASVFVVDGAGRAVPIEISVSPDDATALVITGKGGWPYGALEVTVADTAADVFGVTLATKERAILLVALPDGGVPDAAAGADAGADAGDAAADSR